MICNYLEENYHFYITNIKTGLHPFILKSAPHFIEHKIHIFWNIVTTNPQQIVYAIHYKGDI